MTQHVYTVDIFEQLERFRHHHRLFANPQVPEHLQTEYLNMVIEQLIAHFEYENVAVMSFISHYTVLITNPTKSPLFKYHPLKFLKQMDNVQYEQYLYCLYGLAEDMLKLFQSHRLYNPDGVLMASFQHVESDVLYLIVRPEVSSVFLY